MESILASLTPPSTNGTRVPLGSDSLRPGAVVAHLSDAVLATLPSATQEELLPGSTITAQVVEIPVPGNSRKIKALRIGESIIPAALPPDLEVGEEVSIRVLPQGKGVALELLSRSAARSLSTPHVTGPSTSESPLLALLRALDITPEELRRATDVRRPLDLAAAVASLPERIAKRFITERELLDPLRLRERLELPSLGDTHAPLRDQPPLPPTTAGALSVLLRELAERVTREIGAPSDPAVGTPGATTRRSGGSPPLRTLLEVFRTAPGAVETPLPTEGELRSALLGQLGFSERVHAELQHAFTTVIRADPLSLLQFTLDKIIRDAPPKRTEEEEQFLIFARSLRDALSSFREEGGLPKQGLELLTRALEQLQQYFVAERSSVGAEGAPALELGDPARRQDEYEGGWLPRSKNLLLVQISSSIAQLEFEESLGDVVENLLPSLREFVGELESAGARSTLTFKAARKFVEQLESEGRAWSREKLGGELRAFQELLSHGDHGSTSDRDVTPAAGQVAGSFLGSAKDEVARTVVATLRILSEHTDSEETQPYVRLPSSASGTFAPSEFNQLDGAVSEELLAPKLTGNSIGLSALVTRYSSPSSASSPHQSVGLRPQELAALFKDEAVLTTLQLLSRIPSFANVDSSGVGRAFIAFLQDLKARIPAGSEPPVQATREDVRRGLEELARAFERSPSLDQSVPPLLAQASLAGRALEQALRTQEVMTTLQPVLRALGEPIFLLFPTLFKGLLSQVSVSVATPRHSSADGGREREGGEGGFHEGSMSRSCTLSVSLKKLGPVGVQFSIQAHVLRVAIYTESEAKAVFLRPRVDSLVHRLSALGLTVGGCTVTARQLPKSTSLLAESMRVQA